MLGSTDGLVLMIDDSVTMQSVEVDDRLNVPISPEAFPRSGRWVGSCTLTLVTADLDDRRVCTWPSQSRRAPATLGRKTSPSLRCIGLPA